MKHALITGVAGFIGSHLADQLLARGWKVTGIDNFDEYYSSEIKRRNICGHFSYDTYTFVNVDIRNKFALDKLKGDYDVIVHLAAKAGVRPSLLDPVAYHEVNVIGTQNILELAKKWGVKKVLFASSSSVYGKNAKVPWSEDDNVLLPVSPYAVTKVSGEMIGHIYSTLYGIQFISLRFFTVYGPRQRPDLVIHKFAQLMLEGREIPIFGDGSSLRDYTYIDDVVNGILKALDYEETRYEIFNIGSGYPIKLIDVVRVLENVLKVKAKIKFLPFQLGDVPQTWANIDKARKLLGYEPNVPFDTGVKNFVQWFLTSNHR